MPLNRTEPLMTSSTCLEIREKNAQKPKDIHLIF
jgi:hypothetical protein